MDGRPRNYPSAGGDPRLPPSRPSTGGARGSPSAASSGSTPSAMSRAERFDDERKRITESCFAKTDDQGQRQSPSCQQLCNAEEGCFWTALYYHCSRALTQSSPGIVHHAHSCQRGWLLPTVSAAAHRSRIEQESPNYYDIRPKHWQSQAAQSARKCQRDLLDWQIMAHGGLVSCGELRASEPKE
jgi:hypothetical protein